MGTAYPLCLCGVMVIRFAVLPGVGTGFVSCQRPCHSPLLIRARVAIDVWRYWWSVGTFYCRRK